MKSFGIAALALSIFGIFTPIFGVFISGLSGLIAYFSAGKAVQFGLAAIILNLANLFFLSPIFFLAAMSESASNVKLPGANLEIAFYVLLIIQLIGISIFLTHWLVTRRESKNVT